MSTKSYFDCFYRYTARCCRGSDHRANYFSVNVRCDGKTERVIAVSDIVKCSRYLESMSVLPVGYSELISTDRVTVR